MTNLNHGHLKILRQTIKSMIRFYIPRGVMGAAETAGAWVFHLLAVESYFDWVDFQMVDFSF